MKNWIGGIFGKQLPFPAGVDLKKQSQGQCKQTCWKKSKSRVHVQRIKRKISNVFHIQIFRHFWKYIFSTSNKEIMCYHLLVCLFVCIIAWKLLDRFEWKLYQRWPKPIKFWRRSKSWSRTFCNLKVKARFNVLASNSTNAQ